MAVSDGNVRGMVESRTGVIEALVRSGVALIGEGAGNARGGRRAGSGGVGHGRAGGDRPPHHRIAGDAAVLRAIFGLTICRDLTETIIVGCVLGSVLFIHRMSRSTMVVPRPSFVPEAEADMADPARARIAAPQRTRAWWSTASGGRSSSGRRRPSAGC